MVNKTFHIRSLVIRQRVDHLAARINQTEIEYEYMQSILHNYLQQARDLADPLLEGYVCQVLGLLETFVLNYDTALTHLQAAFNLFERENDLKSLLAVGNRIGSLYEISRQSGAAKAWYQQTLARVEAADLTGDLIDEVLALVSNLGITCTSQNEWDEAEVHYRRALRLFEEHGFRSRDRSRLAISISNVRSGMVEIYTRRGDFPAAWQDALLVMSLVQESRISARIFIAHLLLLSVAVRDPNPIQLPESCWQTVRQFTLQPDLRPKSGPLMAQYLLHSAEAFKADGYTSWARTCAKEAFRLFAELRNDPGQAEVVVFLRSLPAEASSVS